MNLQALIASEAAKQAAGAQALASAQTKGQLGLEAAKATELSKQFGANLGLQSARTKGELDLQAAIASAQNKQVQGAQALTNAAQMASYNQQANELTLRAQEAAARGDQFAASFALSKLQEVNRAAESLRDFEYKEERNKYLDPRMDLAYAMSLLSSLPSGAVSAGGTGTRPDLAALLAAAGLGSLFPSGG